MIKAYFFDLDGTLAEYPNGGLLAGVKEWFDANQSEQFAILSNQGGVGLGYWMTANNFGDPSKYPTELDVDKRIASVIEAIGAKFRIYTCYAYQSKKGEWSPAKKLDDWRWQAYYRKPNPGMIYKALSEMQLEARDVVYVGDWDEDCLAAQAAGVEFADADQFFGRNSTMFKRG